MRQDNNRTQTALLSVSVQSYLRVLNPEANYKEIIPVFVWSLGVFNKQQLLYLWGLGGDGIIRKDIFANKDNERVVIKAECLTFSGCEKETTENQSIQQRGDWKHSGCNRPAKSL